MDSKVKELFEDSFFANFQDVNYDDPDNDEYGDDPDFDTDDGDPMEPLYYLTASDGSNVLPHFKYGEMAIFARRIEMQLYYQDIVMEVKGVQIGRNFTRYLLDFENATAQQKFTKKLKNKILRIVRACGADEITAPYDGNNSRLAVDVFHQPLDQYSKQALLTCLQHNNGRISIAFLQRKFAIGYNRAGSMFDRLQQLNCIETLQPDDPATKPITVTVSTEDVEVLFPDNLGWDQPLDQ